MNQENDLQRFVSEQKTMYPIALAEIRRGRKDSHWMWFIFPQMRGLGMSTMSHFYGIQNLEEAVAYLQDPYLGKNLLEITQALLESPTDDAYEIFGGIDKKKLKSSMTLFAYAAGEGSVFHRVLDKFFHGKMDSRTEELLGLR